MSRKRSCNHSENDVKTSINSVDQNEAIKRTDIQSANLDTQLTSSPPLSLIEQLVAKEIALCAKDLQIDHRELHAWAESYFSATPNYPTTTLLHLLRTARINQLDPLQEEVQAIRYGQDWQVSISVDGWLKLLHRHPHFNGITFSQSANEIGLPIWMECAIYRSDRTIPTTVREYYQEVKQDGDLWKNMPRRMLRHRTLQQCARVALGVGIISVAYSNGLIGAGRLHDLGSQNSIHSVNSASSDQKSASPVDQNLGLPQTHATQHANSLTALSQTAQLKNQLCKD
jgi:hypothetical protein